MSCTHTPTPTPPPPTKKLIGFGSFEKVNLKLAGGVRTPGPPGQLRPWLQMPMLPFLVLPCCCPCCCGPCLFPCICFLQCISEPGAERETTWKSFIKVLLEVPSSLAPPFFFILRDSGSSSSSQKHLAWCLIVCDFPTLLRPPPPPYASEATLVSDHPHALPPTLRTFP